jgi:hypothetical protein
VRTTVLFESDHFETIEPRPDRVNEGCFGDDVAAWLIQAMTKRGVKTDSEPAAEDFGWYFRFTVRGVEYCFVIGHRPADRLGPGVWIATIERARGIVGSLLGLRNRGVQQEALELVHDILSRSRKIRRISWHHTRDVLAGNETGGAPCPGEA